MSGRTFDTTAVLRSIQDGAKPILIRIESRAGQGADKPTAKIIEKITDQWAFLVKTLGFETVVPSK